MYINVSIYLSVWIFSGSCRHPEADPDQSSGRRPGVNSGDTPWPVHDFVITNIVGCLAYKRKIEGGGVYCPIGVRWYCNSAGNAGRPEE